MLNRWPEISPIFDEAVSRPSEARAAFLDVACADDAELREMLDRLLAASEGDDSLLDRSLAARTLMREAAADVVAPAASGERIGAYRVLREIGRGGMGTVYLAERVEGGFAQRVALKLIKRGMDTDAVVRRFERERDLLATLQHPNVARLLDGGATADGRPYFAMEYIEGRALGAYCDAHRLGLGERLRLFLTVCEAVQYAHQNLVVHRDLKPSNILVTETEHGAPQVKLLDFGIAKLLADDGPEGAAEDGPALTRTGERLMTPEYAAPEQIRGLRPTTATDVYALGVVLYELLSGRRPYEVGGKALSEVEQDVLETEPKRPSTIAEADAAAVRDTTPDRLRRSLRGDLDTICLKALRKEPERRYASAEGLAADVQRFLDERPIAARPDALGYRARKFVRRNALGVALAALVVLALGAGLVGTAWQARVAAQERDAKALEADRANATLGFVLGIFEEVNPSEAEGAPITAHRIVEAGLGRLAGLQAQPLTQARMMAAMGELSYSLGLYPTSDSLWRASLRRRRALLGPEHPEVAESLLGLATSLQDRAADSALVLLREALRINERAFGLGDERTLETLNRRAWMYYKKSRYDEALADYERALTQMEGTAWDGHPQKAESLYGQGSVLLVLDRYDEAEAYLQHALRIRREVLGERDPDTIYTLYTLAVVLKERGHLDEAHDRFAETLQLMREVLGPEHNQVANVLNALGEIERERGDADAAGRYYRDAFEVYGRSLGSEHHYRGIPLANWGLALLDAGQLSEAEDKLRAAIDIYVRDIGPTYSRAIQASVWLGRCLVAQGRFAEATPILIEALKALQAVEDSPRRQEAAVEALDQLILLSRAQSDAAAATYEAQRQRLLETVPEPG